MKVIMYMVFLGMMIACDNMKANYEQIGERVDPSVRLNHAKVLTGKKVFKRNCSSCHGKEGVGVTGMGPRLNSPEFLGLASDDFIEKTIEEGRKGTFMMPYGKNKRIKEKIPDLVAYIRSWQRQYNNFREYEVDWDSKIEGSPKLGSKLYGRYCAYCHGTNGAGYNEGGAGTAIGGEGFLNHASDDYIKKTILVGRSGTAMKPFGTGRGLADISHEEIDHIVAYLRSLQKKKNEP